jgi:phosphatidylglycerol:prolipoprotein diacylglycerol transferase
MYPIAGEVLGTTVRSWNVTLVLGIVVGYLVLRRALRRRRRAPLPRALVLRWAFTAYVSVLGAQLFAYAFDRGTHLTPPLHVHPLRYYLDPSAGPKTLYGGIVVLPLAVLAVSAPWRDLAYRDALAAWTPSLCATLALARVGCFLEGCCYGVATTWGGIRFPPESLLYWEHLRAGRIVEGEWTQPVVPTQLLEAAALGALALWAFTRLRDRGRAVFLPTVIAYSLVRFALEFARADPVRNAFGPLSSSQWIALAIVTLTMAAMLARRRPAGAAT